MKAINTYIGSLLGILMIAACLLPSLHALSHDVSVQNVDVEYTVAVDTIDCDLCDFHFSSLDTPLHIDYITHSPVKESVYIISLTETVFLYPNNLFSLRAPPSVFV